MEQIIDKFWVNIQRAFATWGWWCLAIILATFLVMIGVNALIKFIFRKASSSQLQGLRKAISGASVFGVAIGVIYLFAIVDRRYGLCEGTYYATGVVISNSVPVSFCAMSLWAIVKAIGRVGILPLLNAIRGKVQQPFKKFLEQIPLEENLRNSIFEKLEAFLSESATSANESLSEYIDTNTVAINRKVAGMLSGLVNSETVATCTELFIQAVTTKYSKKKGE